MTVSPPIVSIPQQPEWDDVHLLWMRQQRMTRYPEVVEAAARKLVDDGASSARTFSLPIHPWLLGQPHRIRYLDEAIARLARLDGVWWTTAHAIADEFARSTPAHLASASDQQLLR